MTDNKFHWKQENSNVLQTGRVVSTSEKKIIIENEEEPRGVRNLRNFQAEMRTIKTPQSKT